MEGLCTQAPEAGAQGAHSLPEDLSMASALSPAPPRASLQFGASIDTCHHVDDSHKEVAPWLSNDSKEHAVAADEVLCSTPETHAPRGDMFAGLNFAQ